MDAEVGRRQSKDSGRKPLILGFFLLICIILIVLNEVFAHKTLSSIDSSGVSTKIENEIIKFANQVLKSEYVPKPGEIINGKLLENKYYPFSRAVRIKNKEFVFSAREEGGKIANITIYVDITGMDDNSFGIVLNVFDDYFKFNNNLEKLSWVNKTIDDRTTFYETVNKHRNGSYDTRSAYATLSSRDSSSAVIRLGTCFATADSSLRPETCLMTK